MKKLLVLGVVLAMFAPCFAQVEEGDLILGGSLRIQTDGSKTDDGDNVAKDPKHFNFDFGPHVQYMLSEHFSVGGEIFYNISATSEFEYISGPDDEVKVTDKTSGFGLGPAVRYWWPIGEKQRFGLFAEGGIGFATFGGKDEEYNFIEDEVVSTDMNRTNRVYVYAYPGMYFAPTKRFFFEIQFGGFGFLYNHDTESVQDSDTKLKDGYFVVGGDLDQMFFGDTEVGFNFVF